MPELPEVEYVVRRLREYAADATIRKVYVADARVLRPQTPRLLARRTEGRRVTGYERRAKNILIHLQDGWTLRIHLGMTGHLYWLPLPEKLPPATRAHFDIPGGRLVYEDSRMFGRIHVHQAAELPELFADYGPEPLSDAFTWQSLRAAAQNLRGPVKPFLLDQRRVAGLGNIWAAEALFAAGIDPRRGVATLGDAEWRALHRAIRRVLKRAIAGTFTVTAKASDFPDADLLTMRVYGREGQPCRRCRRAVRRMEQASRSTFFCPNCQR
jgi:formamidopyrimidine-DNA glycosylase